MSGGGVVRGVERDDEGREGKEWSDYEVETKRRRNGCCVMLATLDGGDYT